MTAIDTTSATIAETARQLRDAANAAGSYHAREHGGTYGAAKDALITALASGLAGANRPLDWATAKNIATEIESDTVISGFTVAEALAHGGIEVLA